MIPAASFMALLPSFGGGEMMVVLLLVLLLFGGERMPQLAKGLGKALREFRKAASGVEQEFKKALDEVPDVPPTKPAMPAPIAKRIDPPAPPGTKPPS
ncbi:MAG: twin-arginine translocation protein TatA/E family subunit [Verrucomicrobia bacterium]|nr:twin-arginine translocation protein TatA/E family subunit [Verrucomicrobiota bacterium]